MFKKVVKGFVSLMVANTLLSSSGVFAAENNKVSIWAGETNLKVLEYAAEKYNEKNGKDSIVLEKTNIGAPDIYQKITTGLQAGGEGLPDVMLVEDSVMPDYLDTFSDYFLDLNAKGFDQISGKFAQYKVDAVSSEGVAYGFPFDAGPAAVFYRVDLFEQAGIKVEEITTWEKYIEAAKVLEEKTGKKMLAFSFNGEDWVYRILMNQLGSFYFNKEGKPAIDSEESRKAFDVLLGLKDYAVNINNFSEGVSAVVNEEVATVVSGVWYSGVIKGQAPDQSGKWSAFELPAFEEGGNRAANLGGSGFLMSQDAGNPDLAAEFMTFFATDEDVQMYAFKEFGLFPSLLSAKQLLSELEPDAFFKGNIWPVFTENLDSIPEINYANYAIGTDIAQATKAKIMAGEDIEKALQEGQKQLEDKTKR